MIYRGWLIECNSQEESKNKWFLYHPKELAVPAECRLPRYSTDELKDARDFIDVEIEKYGRN